MKFRFDDKLQIPSSRKLQATGQMIAEGAIARTGVLRYQAKDLGSMFSDKDPSEVIRVAQLSEDLFSEETLEKFRSAPITIGHPEQDVDTHNMKELGKGTLEGKPYKEDNHLAANLVLSDAEAIELVNSGVSELSVRAYYTLTRCDDSEDYDAVRTIQTVNHVAIVERGRAGATCRISDSEDGEITEELVADIIPIEEGKEEVVEEIVEEVIEEVEVVDSSLSDALSEVEALKAKLDALQSKLDDALCQIPTQEDIDAKVETRLEFLSKVQKLSDVDTVGKSESEIKASVVAKVTGLTLNDKSDDYIDARFQILLEDSEGDTPMSRVIKQITLSDCKPIVPEKSSAELARERMIARYSKI